jgi:hypothetical protein
MDMNYRQWCIILLYISLAAGAQVMPYDPHFGPDNCGEYPPGGVIKFLCERSGNDLNSNCVRKCLQDKYPVSYEETPPIMNPWYWGSHPLCFWECGWTPWGVF